MQLNIVRNTLKLLPVVLLSACTTASNLLNPFYESPTPTALLGEANDHALGGNQQKEESARKALEAMATYQRAHHPEPVKPVMNPAIVRLMWVPDHLNRAGDLVPAHYYYLKVKRDQWAVSDAFEMEAQLSEGAPATTTIPYINAAPTR